MSDVMFFGVLRMPYDIALGGEIASRQFYSRAQEAANRVEALTTERDALQARLDALIAQATAAQPVQPAPQKGEK